jgi:hypothetical protein
MVTDRARLPVALLRRGCARADQPGHPPPAGAADEERPAQDRASELRCCCRCRARRSSTTATRSAWATTTTSATATGCARRCNGRPTATPGSAGQPAAAVPAGRSSTRSTASRRSTSRRRQRIPSSLLNWMRRMITVRKRHTAFGRGEMTLLYPRNRKILAYLREHEDETVLCVANLSPTGAGGGTRPARLRGRGAGGVDRPLGLPAGWRPALHADAAGLRLLLVRARRRRGDATYAGAAGFPHAHHPRRNPVERRWPTGQGASSSDRRCASTCRSSAGSPARGGGSGRSRSSGSQIWAGGGSFSRSSRPRSTARRSATSCRSRRPGRMRHRRCRRACRRRSPSSAARTGWGRSSTGRRTRGWRRGFSISCARSGRSRASAGALPSARPRARAISRRARLGSCRPSRATPRSPSATGSSSSSTAACARACSPTSRWRAS